MKILELKLKKDVLIVEAPLDAYDVSIGTHCIGVRTNENVEKDTNGFYHIYKKGLFFGDVDMKLEFLCKGSELTEEIASELCHNIGNCLTIEGDAYLDDENDEDYFEFAKEAIISAVESKGFHWLENPISNPNKIIQTSLSFKKFAKHSDLFYRFEAKTFKNPLIFIKNYVQ